MKISKKVSFDNIVQCKMGIWEHVIFWTVNLKNCTFCKNVNLTFCDFQLLWVMGMENLVQHRKIPKIYPWAENVPFQFIVVALITVHRTVIIIWPYFIHIDWLIFWIFYCSTIVENFRRIFAFKAIPRLVKKKSHFN